LETLNEKLSSQLEEKTTAAAKLSDQLQSCQTELDRLRVDNAKVSNAIDLKSGTVCLQQRLILLV